MKRRVLRAAALGLASSPPASRSRPPWPPMEMSANAETVCATDLFVRVTAPHGAWMGTLHKGQTILVERVNGDWVYGFAYGDINRRGWVQNGWFC